MILGAIIKMDILHKNQNKKNNCLNSDEIMSYENAVSNYIRSITQALMFDKDYRFSAGFWSLCARWRKRDQVLMCSLLINDVFIGTRRSIS